MYSFSSTFTYFHFLSLPRSNRYLHRSYLFIFSFFTFFPLFSLSPYSTVYFFYHSLFLLFVTSFPFLLSAFSTSATKSLLSYTLTSLSKIKSILQKFNMQNKCNCPCRTKKLITPGMTSPEILLNNIQSEVLL